MRRKEKNLEGRKTIRIKGLVRAGGKHIGELGQGEEGGHYDYKIRKGEKVAGERINTTRQEGQRSPVLTTGKKSKGKRIWRL